MTMDSDKTVTAVFDSCRYSARIIDTPPSYFDSLQAAYDGTSTNDTVESQDYIFVEDLIIDLDKSVTIKAGYDCDYISTSGKTTINGDVTISNGVVTIQSGTLEVQ
jgi:hypothetical protein